MAFRGKRGFAAIVMASAIMLVPNMGWGASGDGDGTGSLIPSQGGVFTPEQASLNATDVFTSCQNTSASQAYTLDLKALLAKPEGGTCGGGKGTNLPQAITITTECPKGAAVDSGAVRCESLQEKGHFSDAALNKILGLNMCGVDAASCHDSKFKALQGELACLAGQANNLTKQIGDLSKGVQQNLGVARTYFNEMKGYVDERKAQAMDIQKTLAGDPSVPGKEVGLVALAAQAKGRVLTMPSIVTQVKAEAELLVQEKIRFEDQVNSRIAGLTQQCLSTRVDPTWICPKGGPALPLNEYVACMYQDRLSANSKGQHVEAWVKNAQKRAVQLKSVMDSLFNDMPKDGSMPSSTDAALASGSGNARVKNMVDFESLYGDQLRAYQDAGIDFYSFVRDQTNRCFSENERKVAAERQGGNSAVRKRVEDLTARETNALTGKGIKSTDGSPVISNAQSLVEEWSKAYGDLAKALTGQYTPLQTDKCNGQGLSVMANCLEQIKNNYTELVNGKTPASKITMTIKGAKPEMNHKFECFGLEGCVTALQTKRGELDREIQKVGGQRMQELAKFNTSVTEYFQCMANGGTFANGACSGVQQGVAGGLNAQNQALIDRVKQLNLAMTSLGVTQGLEFSKLEPCDTVEYEKDNENKDALIKPGNALKEIGCRMSPPMYDVSGDGFSSVNASLADAMKTNDEELAKAKKAALELAALKNQCISEELTKARDALADAVGKLSASMCIADKNLCDPKNQLTELADTVSHLTDHGLDTSPIYSLGTGIGEACDSPGDLPKVRPEAKDYDDTDFNNAIDTFNSCVKKSAVKADESLDSEYSGFEFGRECLLKGPSSTTTYCTVWSCVREKVVIDGGKEWDTKMAPYNASSKHCRAIYSQIDQAQTNYKAVLKSAEGGTAGSASD